MAQVRVDPMKPLVELETIIRDLEAAKDVDRESRQLSKVWEGIGTKFDDALLSLNDGEGKYAKLDVPPGDLAKAGELSRKIAELLNPIAEIQWTKEHVEELLVGVRFFLISQLYDPETAARAQEVIEKAGTVTKTRVTGGIRGTAPTVEGRPETVEVWATFGEEPERMSRQKGNSENSPGNILKSVVGWLERNHQIQATDEMKEQITEAIRQCVVEGRPEVTIGDFAVIRHA